MNINWDAIIEGTTAGVIAAVLLAPWGVLRDLIRNRFLKRALQCDLEKISCGHSICGLTTEVRNFVGKEFTVREVTLVTKKLECSFIATGQVVSCAKPSKPKLTRKQLRQLKRGEDVAISPPRFVSRTWNVEPTPSGFAKVAPFTSHEFLLPSEQFVNLVNDTPICLRITVEYESWTKKSVLLQQSTKGQAVRFLRDVFAHYRREILNGNLNNARTTFGLSKINLHRDVEPNSRS